ncbi:MAG: hypothetical protein EON86_20690 [Brevundimonas sp.]|nr:MAG: hypothetical protein EON86_20690 [Brevundimonas sp.]
MAFALPGGASACRAPRSSAEHLSSRLNAPYEAIVAVTVAGLETEGDAAAPSWRAALTTRAVLQGLPKRDAFIAGELGGLGLCWRVPTPAVGERWIIFLTNADDESGFAYPEALLPDGFLQGGMKKGRLHREAALIFPTGVKT